MSVKCYHPLITVVFAAELSALKTRVGKKFMLLLFIHISILLITCGKLHLRRTGRSICSTIFIWLNSENLETAEDKIFI